MYQYIPDGDFASSSCIEDELGAAAAAAAAGGDGDICISVSVLGSIYCMM
jgi:hypothetical protein